LKLHDAEACGVCEISEKALVRQKLKLHDAEACGVGAVSVKASGKAEEKYASPTAIFITKLF